MPDVRYRRWDRGRRVRPFPASAPVWNGEGNSAFGRVKFFFASALPLVIWRRFSALRGIHRAAMAWRRETNAFRRQTSAECSSSRTVSLCSQCGGSLPSGRLREGVSSPWRVEAETGRRRPELDSTGSEDVRRTEKAKEGLKVWRARESHGT